MVPPVLADVSIIEEHTVLLLQQQRQRAMVAAEEDECVKAPAVAYEFLELGDKPRKTNMCTACKVPMKGHKCMAVKVSKQVEGKSKKRKQTSIGGGYDDFTPSPFE